MMKKKENAKIIKLKKFLLRNAFPLFGFGALIWFLIRVIPKPTRAGYPCMKVAAPMASSFVLWLIGLSATLFSFQGFKKAFVNSSYGKMFLFLFVMGISIIFTFNQSSIESLASSTEGFEETVTANNPIGEAKGIHPGRVVWVWNPDATNENCTNSYTGDESTWDNGGVEADEEDDGWFLSKNNNQEVIDNMLSDGLKQLTGDATDLAAWESIFTHFNENKHGLSEGYSNGQKIFIKINATSTWGKGQFWGNISVNNIHLQNDFYGISETSPHLILSLLRQLVNVYGVQQENISVGDPLKHIYKNSYDLWYSEFPNINYMAYEGGDGRIGVTETDNEVITYSDKGNAM
jgi:hypothetical protein